MDRRAALAGLAAVAASPYRLAQTAGRTYRVGAMFGVGSTKLPIYQDALVKRLADRGFVAGRNLRIDARSTTEQFHDDREIARELLALKPDALPTFLTRPTQSAQSATKTLPIVFVWVADPVASGILKSLAKPEGNVTGVTNRFGELLVKRLELARELIPSLMRIGVLGWIDGPFYQANSAPLRNAARALQIELVETPSQGQWATALDRALGNGAEAILPLYVHALQPVTSAEIIRAAREKRVPVILADADAVTEGGLVSYDTNLVDDVRRAADLLARVLMGAKPADLPVDQAARFELAVNLKTAREIGITVPGSILLRADKVIE